MVSCNALYKVCVCATASCKASCKVYVHVTTSCNASYKAYAFRLHIGVSLKGRTTSIWSFGCSFTCATIIECAGFELSFGIIIVLEWEVYNYKLMVWQQQNYEGAEGE